MKSSVSYTNPSQSLLERVLSSSKTQFVPKADGKVLFNEQKCHYIHRDRRKKKYFCLEVDGKRVHKRTKYQSLSNNPTPDDLYLDAYDKIQIYIPEEHLWIVQNNCNASRDAYNFLIETKIHLPPASEREGSYYALCKKALMEYWKGESCPSHMKKGNCEANVVHAAIHEFIKALNEAEVLLSGRPSKIRMSDSSAYIGSQVKYKDGKVHLPITQSDLWFDYKVVGRSAKKIQEIKSTIIEIHLNKKTGKTEVYARRKGISKPRFSAFIRENAVIKELKYTPEGHDDCDYGEVPNPDKFTMERRKIQADALENKGVPEWFRIDNISSDEGIVPIKKYNFSIDAFGIKWRTGHEWPADNTFVVYKKEIPPVKNINEFTAYIANMNHRQISEYKQRYPKYFM